MVDERRAERRAELAAKADDELNGILMANDIQMPEGSTREQVIEALLDAAEKELPEEGKESAS